jgi:hypothetical protein
MCWLAASWISGENRTPNMATKFLTRPIDGGTRQSDYPTTQPSHAYYACMQETQYSPTKTNTRQRTRGIAGCCPGRLTLGKAQEKWTGAGTRVADVCRSASVVLALATPRDVPQTRVIRERIQEISGILDLPRCEIREVRCCRCRLRDYRRGR